MNNQGNLKLRTWLIVQLGVLLCLVYLLLGMWIVQFGFNLIIALALIAPLLIIHCFSVTISKVTHFNFNRLETWSYFVILWILVCGLVILKRAFELING